MHRVYVHDGDIWTLASAYVKAHGLLSGSDKYVVYETTHPPFRQEVCALTKDGQRLCDFGPEHVHGD